MKMHIGYLFLFFKMTLFLGVLCCLETNVQDTLSWYEQINQLNRQAYPIIDADWQENNYVRYLQRCFAQRMNPSLGIQRLCAGKIYQPMTYIPVIDITTVKNLDLVIGSHVPTTHLVGKLNKTVTKVGFCALMNSLATPLVDKKILHDRQELIRFFVHQPEALKEVRSICKELALVEPVMLGFWQQWDPFRDGVKSYLFFQGDSILNDSRWALEAKSLAGHTERSFWLGMSTIATIVLALYGMELLMSADHEQQAGQPLMHQEPFYAPNNCRSYGGYLCSLLWGVGGRKMQGIVSLLGACYAGMGIAGQWDWFKGSYLFERYVQELLVSAGRYIRGIQQIQAFLEKNPACALRLPGYRTLLLYQQDCSASLNAYKECVELLAQPTFSEPSVYCWPGILLKTYRMIVQVKEDVARLCSLVADLDLYTSLAHLYRKQRGSPTSFCFASYDDEGSGPRLAAEGLWNPFIDKKRAVPNNFYAGGADHKRHALITGPNAGGKSTFLRSIALAQILAQSLTIVPAQSYTCSLFHAIETYMQVTDDLGSGQSLFKTEVARAQALIEKMALLEKKGQYGLMLGDEMMSGTSPQEAEVAAYAMAQLLGSYKTSMIIIATHYTLLTQLESADTDFINYHLSVKKEADGSLSYPFTLEQGVSHQHVAFDILRAAGVQGSLLSRAQEIFVSDR